MDDKLQPVSQDVIDLAEQASEAVTATANHVDDILRAWGDDAVEMSAALAYYRERKDRRCGNCGQKKCWFYKRRTKDSFCSDWTAKSV